MTSSRGSSESGVLMKTIVSGLVGSVSDDTGGSSDFTHPSSSIRSKYKKILASHPAVAIHTEPGNCQAATLTTYLP